MMIYKSENFIPKCFFPFLFISTNIYDYQCATIAKNQMWRQIIASAPPFTSYVMFNLFILYYVMQYENPNLNNYFNKLPVYVY